MQNFDYNIKQMQFARERKDAKRKYEDAMDVLRAEFKAKELKLSKERDCALDDIAQRECKYVQQYRDFKKQNQNTEKQ